MRERRQQRRADNSHCFSLFRMICHISSLGCGEKLLRCLWDDKRFLFTSRRNGQKQTVDNGQLNWILTGPWIIRRSCGVWEWYVNNSDGSCWGNDMQLTFCDLYLHWHFRQNILPGSFSISIHSTLHIVRCNQPRLIDISTRPLLQIHQFD